MKFSRVLIRNYKNIENADISFKEINAIVGQNGAGKTNIISALKFLKYYLRNGPEDSLLAVGGGEALFNQFHKFARPLTIGIEVDGEGQDRIYGIFGADFLHISSALNLTITPTRDSKQISSINQIFTFFLQDKSSKREYKLILELKTLNTSKAHKNVAYAINVFDESSKKVPKIKKKLFNQAFFLNALKSVVESHYDRDPKGFKTVHNFNHLIVSFVNAISLSGLEIYSFDPTLSKKASELGFNSVSFSEQGENFSSILRNFSEHEKREYILNMQSFFPNFNNYSILPTSSHHEVVMFYEKYGSKTVKTQFGSISDGMAVVALVLAAVKRSRRRVVVLEEPERFIHPGIISRLMDYLNQEAAKTQIIITTHSPLVVNELNPEQLVFIERTENGASISRRIQDIPEEMIEDLGLGDLYANSLI